MIVERAYLQDADTLFPLVFDFCKDQEAYHECFHFDNPLDRTRVLSALLRDLDAANTAYFVARDGDGGSPMGYIAVGAYPIVGQQTNRGTCVGAYIRPEHRGSEVWWALYNAALSWLKECGILHIQFHVAEGNTWMHRIARVIAKPVGTVYESVRGEP